MPEQHKNFKRKALSAIIWNAIQKYGSLIISFGSNIILARLLTPNDFGIIGLLSVFISVANVITESGFNSALIQRKNVTEVDYNTVFYWNLIVSIFLVVFLYVLAPAIAKYFDRPALTDLLRVESIILIVNSFCIVQTSRLMKFLQFNILAIRTISATLIAAMVGILLALNGFGVWSLVWQAITSSIVGAILLWSVTDWKPKFQYSWESFRNMFKFGAYISISSVCNTLYLNLQSFLIGKSFSISDLGYYSQAKKLEAVPVEGTASVLNAVLFPIYSTIVDDRERHIRLVRKNIQIITFLTFPLMLLLILVAPYIFPILFTNKWNESIPMFQILCVAGMFSPLNMANVEIFRSIGEGKIYLILQTIKRLIGVAMILFFVKFGLFVLLWSIAAFGMVSYILNMIFTHRIFGYKYHQQFSDIFPNLILSLGVYILSEMFMRFIHPENIWLGLLSGFMIYILLYILGTLIFNKSLYKLILELFKRN
ncbi:MAG: lipopolysaccharide biosynthesis protein [Muribaculaceae bacterium]|nr:lipopolysaccharide biosynthesis protein [Muribaculaceae bacterium]